MRLLIDGQERDFHLGRSDNGFTDCHVYGQSLAGRKCVVSVQAVPSNLFEHPGRAFTGGHVYETTRDPKRGKGMLSAPANLSPEESHAAHNLALYTINTQALYKGAQKIMVWISCHNMESLSQAVVFERTIQTVNAKWLGHVKTGIQSYGRELGADAESELFKRQCVQLAAAFIVADHYREEFDQLENL